MSKKITHIYLSFIFFILCFFGFYSLRYSIYDLLQENNIYSESLSDEQIKSVKKYLKMTKSYTNTEKIDNDLASILKSGSYQLVVEDDKKQEEYLVLMFQGRSPLSSTYKYCTRIQEGNNMVEWYPSFSQYYLYYRIIDIILSVLLSVLFYQLLKKGIFHLPKMHFFHTLSSKMLFTFGASTLLVFSFFFMTYYHENIVFEFIMDTWFESENYDDIVNNIQKETKNLALSQSNKKVINQILKSYSSNHAYYYIYTDDDTYFTGKSTINPMIYEADEETISSPLYYTYPIDFEDQTATLFITSYPLINLQLPYLIISLLISFSFYTIILQNFIKKRVQSIQHLQEDVFSLAIGNWNHEIKIDETDEIGKLANDLNQMRIAFVHTMENDQQARKANQDLISSLSHDLRTPLTTLKGYLEILNMQMDDVDKRDIYLQKCLNKVEEISYLSNKMFEYSLVYSTEYSAELNPISIPTIQALIKDHITFLQEMDLHIGYFSCTSQADILANQAMLQRILNNIFSNIQKYCDPWKDIVIKEMIENNEYKLSFTNSINLHLDQVESNGIGLKSVQKMMEIHHGSFYKNKTNEIFTIILTFPLN